MLGQRTAISFRLSTKIVLGAAMMLFVSMGLLSFAAYFVVLEDKRAYTFQTQSVENLFISREVDERIRNVLSISRLVLSSTPKVRALSATENETIQTLLKNQDAILEIIVARTHAEGLEAVFGSTVEATDTAVKTVDYSALAKDLYRNGHGESYILREKSRNQIWSQFVEEIDSTKGEYLIAFARFSFDQIAKVKQTGEYRVYNDGLELLLSSGNDFPEPLSTAIMGRARASDLLNSTLQIAVDREQYLGAYQKSQFGLVIMTAVSGKKAFAAARVLGERLGLLGASAILLSILIAYLFAKSLTAPVQALTLATQKIGRGDFSGEIQINTRDEVSVLGRAFNSMSRQIRDLLIQTANQTRLEEELKVASAVQENLLPRDGYRDHYVEIHGYYRAASECGGDWWGFFKAKHLFCFMTADATGHGVPSALMTAAARACFSMLQKFARDSDGSVLSPSRMMEYANQVVYDSGRSDLMMTLFVGVLDLRTGIVKFSSAGHPPPWVLRKGPDGQFERVASLMASGVRLGEAISLSTYEEKEVQITAGDSIFFYTDGIAELEREDGARMSKKRILSLLESEADTEVPELVESLAETMAEFLGPKSPIDDYSFGVLKVHSLMG